MQQTIERIESSSSEKLGSVAVMPDYFLDRFVKVNSLEQLFTLVRNKGLDAGGGSLRGYEQFEVTGGNAVNMAVALGALGVVTDLWAIADGLASEGLKASLEKLRNVRLELISGKCGHTIALEFGQGEKIVNVMVSDVGDLEDFDGSKFAAWDKIVRSEIVSVLNWSANKRGTDLCEKVFSYAKEQGVRLTFFDPADLSELGPRLPEFKRRILDKGLLDIMSLNDNEARVMCKALGDFIIPSDYSDADLKLAVRRLHDICGCAVDLHSRRLSVSSSTDGNCVWVPCHRVRQLLVTGAGDVWDASNVLGYLHRWSEVDRLSFANAAAGLYVSRAQPLPPTFGEVLAFMKKEAAMQS